MNRNIRIDFLNIFVVFVLVGWMGMQPANAAVSHEGTAIVKATDLDKGVVKLAHDPVASLKWPAMTMDFRVEDRTLMQQIKVNDAVTFTFIESNGNYVITHIKSRK